MGASAASAQVLLVMHCTTEAVEKAASTIGVDVDNELRHLLTTSTQAAIIFPASVRSNIPVLRGLTLSVVALRTNAEKRTFDASVRTAGTELVVFVYSKAEPSRTSARNALSRLMRCLRTTFARKHGRHRKVLLLAIVVSDGDDASLTEESDLLGLSTMSKSECLWRVVAAGDDHCDAAREGFAWLLSRLTDCHTSDDSGSEPTTELTCKQSETGAHPASTTTAACHQAAIDLCSLGKLNSLTHSSDKHSNSGNSSDVEHSQDAHILHGATASTGQGDEPECWGAQLMHNSSKCTPGYRRGSKHQKNKFCDACRQGIKIPLDRVATLTEEQHKRYANSWAGGVWASSGTGFNYRVINHTAFCNGPRLLIFEKAKPEGDWQPVPEMWEHDGFIHVFVSKGTLVPIKSEGYTDDSSTNSERSKKRRRPVMPAQLSEPWPVRKANASASDEADLPQVCHSLSKTSVQAVAVNGPSSASTSSRGEPTLSQCSQYLQGLPNSLSQQTSGLVMSAGQYPKFRSTSAMSSMASPSVVSHSLGPSVVTAPGMSSLAALSLSSHGVGRHAEQTRQSMSFDPQDLHLYAMAQNLKNELACFQQAPSLSSPSSSMQPYSISGAMHSLHQIPDPHNMHHIGGVTQEEYAQLRLQHLLLQQQMLQQQTQQQLEQLEQMKANVAMASRRR